MLSSTAEEYLQFTSIVGIQMSEQKVTVLRTERLDNFNRIDLRVVKWDKGKRTVLEKRQIWEKEKDIPTKLLGLNADDVRYVYENYVDIINLL
jgi:hypothetical protein